MLGKGKVEYSFISLVYKFLPLLIKTYSEKHENSLQYTGTNT